ncbi:MAG: hypothetical protein JRE71_15105 [Deltaproteobacteria bacterium]|nr:hypothetical protein [Deltaproteobacteria bacterium]
MFEATWFILNVIVGVPLAVFVLGLGREGLRALIALAFGFRVFQLKWGAGRRVWAKPVGPVELVLAALPFVGSIIAESGSPKRHALARISQAGGPLLIQLVISFWGIFYAPMILETLRSGPATAATFHLANMLLILLHGLIPLETKSGFRTDARSILDAGFDRGEISRHARASYYARYACHWLERAEVEEAKTVLGRGITQLGREPLLVACEAQLQTEDLSSVVDQSQCADALRILIGEDVPRRAKDRATWSVQERIRQSAITSLPLLLAALGVFALESERLSRFAHDHLIMTGAAIAIDGIQSSCKTQLTRWRRWSPALDLVLRDDPEIERDRHDQLAQLERCRGQLEAAVAHQAVAVSAAQQVLMRQTRLTELEPGLWLSNEIRLATVLRHAAELENERSRYRLALAGLGKAAQGLDRARDHVTTLHSDRPEFQTQAGELLDSESARLERTRLQVLTRMGAIANGTAAL